MSGACVSVCACTYMCVHVCVSAQKSWTGSFVSAEFVLPPQDFC